VEVQRSARGRAVGGGGGGGGAGGGGGGGGGRGWRVGPWGEGKRKGRRLLPRRGFAFAVGGRLVGCRRVRACGPLAPCTYCGGMRQSQRRQHLYRLAGCEETPCPPRKRKKRFSRLAGSGGSLKLMITKKGCFFFLYACALFNRALNLTNGTKNKHVLLRCCMRSVRRRTDRNNDSYRHLYSKPSKGKCVRFHSFFRHLFTIQSIL
jgi:hypothetical protein